MTTVDLWTQEFQTNPYPIYSRLRELAPVHRVRGPMGADFWLITRYEDARAALTDPRLSKEPRHTPEWLRRIGAASEGEGPSGKNMLSSDPPDHTRQRRLVSKAFTRGRVEALRPRVQQITDALLDAMAAGDEADLVSAFAVPLPVTVICELLGLPETDRDRLHAWTDALERPTFTEDDVLARKTAATEFRAYVTEQLAEIRAAVDPGLPPEQQPGLLASLIAGAGAGDGLSELELIGMTLLLTIAGHETTVNLIGNGMLALLTHPEQLALLKSDPSLLGPAIEEMLRYDGPVERSTIRVSTEDVEFSGVTIPAGSVVYVSINSADRDSARFPDADRFDITRFAGGGEVGHVAFGHGVHFCLGVPLARLEGQIAFGSLLRRFPDITLAVDPAELGWRGSGDSILRGLTRLPVRLR
ncbi:cytochrome P450 family protein [Nonomuraea guangzhouensis]|uniref:Cytochrome P450 n=1 Tax=Nonomuraea guangzhouensis TaxID=1291555 RepID=A0ABW4FZK4_9ACTN|nr:cytochrome P450 [Nonomuraea guangzhouensis]